MKPGSLVICACQYPKMLGMIIGKSKNGTLRGNKTYQWVEVLCNNKIIISGEMYLTLVE